MAGEDVKAWYSDPVHFLNTDLDSKMFDWALLRHLGYDQFLLDKRVLNLGPCGLDEVMLARTCREWVGVDFATPLLEHLEQWTYPGRGLVKYRAGEFQSLPFTDRSFDTVLDFSSSDHVRDDARAQVRREIFRVLEHGRYYVVTYPNACFINHERETLEFGYERRFTPEEIEAEVKDAGFIITRHDKSWVRSGIIACKAASQ